jgi:hypothetical protein
MEPLRSIAAGWASAWLPPLAVAAACILFLLVASGVPFVE